MKLLGLPEYAFDYSIQHPLHSLNRFLRAELNRDYDQEEFADLMEHIDLCQLVEYLIVCYWHYRLECAAIKAHFEYLNRTLDLSVDLDFLLDPCSETPGRHHA